MAEIGYTGTPDEDMNLSGFVWCTPLFSMPEDGTFTSVSAWLMTESLGATIRVYDESGNTVATSAELIGAGSPGFANAAISFSRTSGQQIRFAMIAQSGQLIGRTSGFAGDLQANDAGGVTYPTFPADPFVQNYSESGRLAVYGTYTAGGGGPSVPEITSLDDITLTNGQTAVTITGTNFGATQGAGSVVISPTDDVDDVDAVAQTVTSWGDTSIDFTAVRGTLAFGATAYVFVTNDDAESNAVGEPVSFVIASATLDFTDANFFFDENGDPAEHTGMTMYVWRSPRPPGSVGTPDQIITAVATDAAGELAQSISIGALESDDTVFAMLFGADGTDVYWAGEKLPTYA